MPRPVNKTELIAAANTQWEKFWKEILSIENIDTITFEFDDPKLTEAHWQRDKNMRDVLVHLYEWHNLLLKWVQCNLAGENIPFLPPPYNWKNYGEMNVEFWKKHQSTSYEKAAELLKESHNQVLKMIENLTDEELFTKKHYPWTGTTNIGSYCISATSSHYDWALKKLKAYKKSKK